MKHRQLKAAERDRERAEAMEEVEAREAAIASVNARIEDIHKSFDTQHHDLDYARKLYLIENSIFGVDIQPIACQIAKLRFFISLLVDQKSDKIIRPLPNLETRLVAANTLIPIEKQVDQQLYFESDQVKKLRLELQRVRHAHFNARTPEAKQNAKSKDAELRAELASALEGLGMSNVTARLLAGWDPYDQNSHAEFFDPAWMFSLSEEDFKGFDIVIGNPPYVRQEKIRDLKPVFKELYKCYTGTADLYVYFYERGIQLLAPDGVFSFITSNKWMKTAYGEKLRVFLKSSTTIRRLADFGDAEIFEAIAYPCIIILTKQRPLPNYSFKAMRWVEGSWLVEDVARHLIDDLFAIEQADLDDEAWRLESKKKLVLLKRIQTAGTPLGEYVKGRFYYGLKTGLNDAFVVNRQKRDELIAAHASSASVLKPFLRGRDVKRWRVESEDLYLIYIPWHFPLHEDQSISGPSAKAESLFAKQYPAIYNHLKSFKVALSERNQAETGVRYEWYALQRWGADYPGEFEQPKLIVPAISDTVNFAADYSGYYCNNKATIFVPDSVLFTCALANSHVSAWYASQTFATKQGGFYDFEPRYSSQIVIPHATSMQQRMIERLAEFVVNHRESTSEVAYVERLLNGLAYQLFFPEDLAKQSLDFFGLLSSKTIPEGDDAVEWRSFKQQIADVNDPIYAALFNLNGLEIVRIIEGRE